MRTCHLLSLTFVLTLGCTTGDDGGDMQDAESGADEAGSDGGGGACVPGQAMPCSCGDGSSGTQTCAADGSGYGACSCDGAGDGMADGGMDGTDDGVDDGSADTTGGSPSDDGLDDSMNDGGSGDSSPEEITWSGDIVPFFYDKCGAGNDACHSSVAYNAELDKGCLGWVSFEDTMLGAVTNSGPEEGTPTGCEDLPLAQRVVDRSPWQCGAFQGNPTEILVVPFSADDSYLVKKMEGTLMCDDSSVMPPPNVFPMGSDQPVTITDAEIQMVRDWIDAGAVID